MLNLKMIAIGLALVTGLGVSTVAVAGPTLNVLSSAVKAGANQNAGGSGQTDDLGGLFSIQLPGSKGAATPKANEEAQRTPTPKPTKIKPTEEKREEEKENETPEENDPRVAQAIAKFFGVSVAEIEAWHDKGFGYGEIVKAYALAQMTGKSPSDIFGMKSGGEGWGKIEQSLCGSAGNPEPSLGAIMSGHATKITPGKCTQNGKGKGNEGNPGKSGKKED